MSSPISSLKKGKKGPLNLPTTVGSNVPYRHHDDPLLEEVTSHLINKKQGMLSQHSYISDPKPGAPSDIDLMQTMMSRIAVLEKQNQLQAKQIQDKDRRISVLDDKCRLYQKVNSEETHSPRYVTDLESRCLSLQKQISEMEEFLLDYGMVWVGNQEDDLEDSDDLITITNTAGDMWDPNSSRTNSRAQSNNSNPHNIDFDKILENIKELNVLAGEGETQIEKTKSGARFKRPDPVQLILYQNGIVMFDGPFRSYEEQSTAVCIADLVDGYFPTELQTRYPDGVPFKVVDKRSVIFEQQKPTKVFTGPGQSVGGDSQPSRLIPSVLNKNTQATVNVESSVPGKKLTADQFLSHLPASVIRRGKVIDIRSSLTDTLKGQEREVCPVTVVHTETMQEIKDRLDIDESVRPPSGRNITTLRIKDTNNHTYVLKMKFSDTIGDVMSYINDLRDSSSYEYRLVSTFPSKVYEDFTESLFAAGLTPNASLHIRICK